MRFALGAPLLGSPFSLVSMVLTTTPKGSESYAAIFPSSNIAAIQMVNHSIAWKV